MTRSIIKNETYEMGKGFLLDVVTTHDCYEAWIWREGYGVKELSFLIPKDKVTKEDFVDRAEKEFGLYAKRYQETYA